MKYENIFKCWLHHFHWPSLFCQCWCFHCQYSHPQCSHWSLLTSAHLVRLTLSYCDHSGRKILATCFHSVLFALLEHFDCYSYSVHPQHMSSLLHIMRQHGHFPQLCNILEKFRLVTLWKSNCNVPDSFKYFILFFNSCIAFIKWWL